MIVIIAQRCVYRLHFTPTLEGVSSISLYGFSALGTLKPNYTM